MRLRALYDYCTERLTLANTLNDVGPVAEVAMLISNVAEGWKDIGRSAAVRPS